MSTSILNILLLMVTWLNVSSFWYLLKNREIASPCANAPKDASTITAPTTNCFIIVIVKFFESLCTVDETRSSDIYFLFLFYFFFILAGDFFLRLVEEIHLACPMPRFSESFRNHH